MYQKHPKPLSSSLFAGGYEDFLDPPRTSNTRTVKPDRDSLLEDLMYYWNIDESHNFDARDPSLVSISRYPLQIAAREWINYVAVMSHSVKQYEYDSNDFRDFARVHVDLKELQRWRRRTMASQQKMRAVTTFLRCAQAFEMKKDRLQWNLILADYEYISENIESCGRLLENMVPVVQILDSRRSFAETATTTRLTTMALIFFPLGLFASMFSMTDRFAPGKSLFWVYFVVAVPICAVVYFLARPRPWMLRVWNSFHIGKARGDAGNSAV
jgi:Mg2+ and Co2+ transporter CorA